MDELSNSNTFHQENTKLKLSNGDSAVASVFTYSCSSRLLTICMCFLALFSMQTMRMNMSVAIVCMVNHTKLSENTLESNDPSFKTGAAVSPGYDRPIIEGSSMVESNHRRNENVSSVLNSTKRNSRCEGERNKQPEQREDGPFLWSKTKQGLILNAYFLGYVISTIPCGWLVNRFSSVKIIGIAATVSSICCMLIPMVSARSPEGVMVLRFLTGSLATTFNPAVQNILGKWLSVKQLASMGSVAFSGATCGSIVISIFSGYMCKYGFADGWQSVFYLNGAFCSTITIAWIVLMRDAPRMSTSRGKDERICVKDYQRTDAKVQSRKVPWKSILTSKPVYATIMCTVAIDSYGIITTLYLPTYFAEVMRFQITSNGVISSLPYIFKSLLQIIGGMLSDLILRKTSLSVGASRKIIVGTGKLLCAASIIIVGFMECEQAIVAVILMVTSIAATGFMEMGITINLIDVAGPFAGLILGFACFMSASSGLVLGSLTTAITSQNSSRETWQIVFAMAAGVVFGTFIIYSTFASGERQSWAESDPDPVKPLETLVPFHDNNEESEQFITKRESETQV